MRENQDEALIEEIRENFQYCVDYWKDIRDEGRKDIRYVSGDPWTEKERKAREDAGRPCLSMDELNQYCNQLINDVRRSKRAIKVQPLGAGATDQTARFRAGLIRQIEYKSNAQSAYACGFENAVQRSFGAWRVSKQYSSSSSFEQELRIKRIPNPESVYFDPDAKEIDCSDGRIAFVVDRMRRKDFVRRWPQATITDFSAELADQAPLWVGEDWVQVAEYWRIHQTRRQLLLADFGPLGQQKVFLDELPGAKAIGKMLRMPDGSMVPVLNSRQTEDPKVCQYITNGLEVLEETDWDGKYIPLIPCFGKEMFVDKGDGAKRVLLSLIRLARDPVMLYCFYRTCEAEVVGMAPKTPFIGYEGQFSGPGWEDVNRKPLPYLEVRATTDFTPAGMVLPLPQRQTFEPPIQALEMGAEAARRSIQSAVGMFNASVGRRDSAAQSGVAINALDQQSDQGSYHFVDNYDAAVQHTGRILEDLLDATYDTERELGIRKPDDEYQTVRINAGPYEDPATKETVEYRTGEGEHEVTITTGSSFQSEREEASKFAESLLTTPLFPRVADLVVKLRNLGPIGDEIAQRLTPPEFQQQQGEGQQMSPQATEAVTQLQQQLQAAMEAGQQMAAELEKAKSGDALKRMEIESRERIALMQAQVQLITTDAKLSSQEGMALLNAKIQELGNQLAALSAPMEPQLEPQPVDPALPIAA